MKPMKIKNFQGSENSKNFQELLNVSEKGLEMSEKQSFSERSQKSSIFDETKFFQKKQFFVSVIVLLLAAFLVNAAASDSKSISVSLVNQDPDPAIAGDVVEVRMGIENVGGEAANNLIIELDTEYPFQMVTGVNPVQKISTIKAYQSGEDMKIIKYKVRVDRDATAGSYELKVTYYEEGSATSTQKSLSLDVQNKESAEVIHIDKSTLVPGKQSSLKFTINNVGNAPLRDLTFDWENEDKIILPVGSDNTKYVKYIDIGDSAELEYQVIADTNADPGLYVLNLNLKYDDPVSDTEKEISTIAGIYVGGETDFDVAFSESSAGETSFSVANIGSNPAYSVSVVIPQQNDWRVTGSSSMIIGNLNKGDYTVASFSLQPMQARTDQTKEMSREEMRTQRNAQAQDTVKIQIYYTDTMGERQSVEKEVSLNPQNLMSSAPEGMQGARGAGSRNQGFFSKYKGYLITIAIVIIGLIIYGKYKKKKLRNPNFKLKNIFHKKKK